MAKLSTKDISATITGGYVHIILPDNSSPTGFTSKRIKLEDFISAGGGTWGSITGTLSDQTDLWQILETIPAEITEITDIPTTETDNALVLAPNGLGGVEWRTELTSYQQLGEIINEDFTNIDNWTNVGTATFSASGGSLQVSGGNNTSSNYLYYNAYGNCNLENLTIEFLLTPDTANSTTYGIGLMLKSFGGYVTTYDNEIKIDLTDTNFGKITFTPVGTNITPTIKTSTYGITASTEQHKITIKLIRNRFQITFTNTVTKLSSVLYYELPSTYPYTAIMANSYKLAIVAYGGSHAVDNFTVVSSDRKNTDYLFVGDSIIKGLTTEDTSKRYVEQIDEIFGVKTSMNAGSGNLIEDINTDELLSIDSSNIVLLLGTNNLGIESAAAAKVKFDSLVTTLVNAGYVVGTSLYICLLPPKNLAAVSTFNSSLISSYPDAIIDIYTPASNSGAFDTLYSLDGIHPNQDYSKIIGDLISNKIGLNPLGTQITKYNYLNYNSNEKVLISQLKFRGYSPFSQLSIISDLSNQLQISTSPAASGLTLSATNTAGGIMYGMYLLSNAYRATQTTGMLIGFYNGAITFYINSGLTSGNTFTPSAIHNFTSVGYYIGGLVNPTALLHIAAGTTSKAQIRLVTGAAPNSPNNGDIWYIAPFVYIRLNSITHKLLLSANEYQYQSTNTGDAVGDTRTSNQSGWYYLETCTVANATKGSGTWVVTSAKLTKSLTDSNEAEGAGTYIDLLTGKSGRGSIIFGDAAGYADFVFSSDGIVTLVTYSANVFTSLQTGTNHLIIKDNGTNVRIVNELGSTVTFTMNISYTN